MYRAIKLNIKLFDFERAVQLAQQHKVHIDTVVYYRHLYLTAASQQETILSFQQLAETVSLRSLRYLDKASNAAAQYKCTWSVLKLAVWTGLHKLSSLRCEECQETQLACPWVEGGMFWRDLTACVPYCMCMLFS